MHEALFDSTLEFLLQFVLTMIDAYLSIGHFLITLMNVED